MVGRNAVVLFAALCVFFPAYAQEKDEESARLEKRFLKSAQRYQVTVGAKNTPLKLIEQPVLNWSNPERKTSSGAIFLWTDNGRPLVAMCVYPSSETSHEHEFQSLSLGPMEISVNKEVVWQPGGPGLTHTKLSRETNPVGATRSLRLRQMRNLARTFSSNVGNTEATAKPLRMLTAPLYRYPKSTNSQVMDGAVFAFVQGTDPEVLLVMEAVKDSSGEMMHWRYGLARMSMVPLRVDHDGKRVWEMGWANRHDPTGSYFTIKDYGGGPPLIPAPSPF